jgi:hypothetical protein
MSLRANSDAHHARASAPQCVNNPPPVELATTTLTQPSRETGALGAANAQIATPATAARTTAIIHLWPRVSGWASRCEWPIITIRGAV